MQHHEHHLNENKEFPPFTHLLNIAYVAWKQLSHSGSSLVHRSAEIHGELV